VKKDSSSSSLYSLLPQTNETQFVKELTEIQSQVGGGGGGGGGEEEEEERSGRRRGQEGVMLQNNINNIKYNNI